MFRSIQHSKITSYKLEGRRTSIIYAKEDSADKLEEKIVEFYPKEYLMKEDNRYVRVFRNGDEVLVVKSPRKPICSSDFPSLTEFEEVYKHKKLQIEKEFNYLKRAYPEDNPYYLKTSLYHYENYPTDYWTYRLVMPLIEGSTIALIFFKTDQIINILMLMRDIALELNRIHQASIIHGNITEKNIIANYSDGKDKYDIHFIDFGHSYSLNSRFALTTNVMNVKQWAPERRTKSDEDVPPNVKQDIYSYGYFLTDLVNTRHQAELNTRFPTIMSILARTQNEAPESRPELIEIVEELETGIKFSRNQ